MSAGTDREKHDGQDGGRQKDAAITIISPSESTFKAPVANLPSPNLSLSSPGHQAASGMANTSGSSSESEKGSARKEDEKGANSGTRSAPVSGKAKMKWPKPMQWIPANWSWPKMKPVIRCAIACWIAVVLFVIPKVEIWMGNVSSRSDLCLDTDAYL
jgi:hypothetical protein